MINNLTVSLVLPVLDEEEGLKTILPLIPAEIDEVVVADNGSTDASADIAKSYGAKIIKVAKRGYGSALQKGIESAVSDIVLFMDADASCSPLEISFLLQPLVEGNISFVSGKREFKNRGICSIFGNTVMKLLVRRLYNIRLQDTQSGMCAFKKNIWGNIKSDSTGMSFSQEIKLKAYLNKNIKTKEVPVSSLPRAGKMKYRVFRDSVSNIFYFIKFYIFKRLQGLN